MITHGADVTLVDEHGHTPLHTAIRNNDKDFFVFLDLNDVSYLKDLFESLLKYTYDNNRIQIAHYLLEKQMSYDTAQYALLVGDGTPMRDTMQAYYDYCGEYELATENYTFLHYLAQNNQHDIVKKLFSHKDELVIPVKINKQDKFGKTPLHYALENFHDELALDLMMHGALTTVSDNHGKTPSDLIT